MDTPARDPILRFFSYKHLPPDLAEVSRPFCELAEHVAAALPRCAERTVALRKLLEAKDAAVRASLPEHTGPAPALEDPAVRASTSLLP